MNGLTTPQVLAEIRDLPALPAAVTELMLSLGDGAASADRIAEKISRDQALAAKALRLANSPFYGMPRQVSSLAEATSVLGLRMLRSVATAAGLSGAFTSPAGSGLDFSAFWRHSIGTALCAQELASALELDADTAFTLGLVHDIGRLLLASRFPARYAEVLELQSKQPGLLTAEAERAVMGLDHAAVGGLIAEHWRFAPAFAQAIVTHHAPPDDNADPALDVVHVADNMAHALDLSQLDADLVPPLSLAAWSRLRLDEAVCTPVMRRAEMQHRAVCEALGM